MQESPPPRWIIASICVEGFKSFNHVQKISFTEGLNVVVGMNGAGKSSLIDAIHFVLGGRSKEMMSSTLHNLINDQGQRDLNVTITFKSISHVSSSFSVRRTVKYTESGHQKGSEYYLSKEGCDFSKTSLQDLARFLENYNIIIELLDKFIVKQEKPSIIIAGPHEILAFFEEISGTSKIHEDIKKTVLLVEQEMRSLQDNEAAIVILRQELSSLEPKCLELLRHHSKVKDFQHDLQRALDCEIVFYSHKIPILSSGRDQVVSRIEEAKQSLDKVTKNLTNQKKVVKEKQDLLQLQTQELSSLKKEVLGKKKQLTKESLTKNRDKDKLEERLRRIEQLKNDIETANREYAAEVNRGKALTEERDSLAQQVKALSSCKHQQPRYREYLGLLEQEQAANAQVDKLRLSIDERMETLSRSNCHKELLLRELEAKNALVQDAERRLFDLRRELTMYSQEAIFSKRKVKDFEREISDLQAKISQVSQQVASGSAKTVSATRYERGRPQWLDLLEDLKAHYPEKIFGLLRDMACLKDAKYTVAVNTVLASSLAKTIIVQSREDAILVTRALESKGLHLRLTLEIVDELKASPRRPPLSKTGFQPLIDCLEILPDALPAYHKHLGSWYLVTDKSEYLRCQKSLHGGNAVTLSGEMFFSDGEIRGSYRSSRTMFNNRFAINSKSLPLQARGPHDPNITATPNFDVAEGVNRIDSLREALDKKFEEMEVERDSLLRASQAQMRLKEQEEPLQREFQYRLAEKSNIELEANGFNERIASLTKDLEEDSCSLDKLLTSRDLAVKQRELYETGCAGSSGLDLKALEKSMTLQNRLKAQEESCRTHHSHTKARAVRIKTLSRSLDKCRSETLSLEQNVEANMQTIETLKAEIDELDKDLKTRRQSMKGLEKEMKTKSSRLEDLQTQKDMALGALKDLRKKLAEAENQLQHAIETKEACKHSRQRLNLPLESEEDRDRVENILKKEGLDIFEKRVSETKRELNSRQKLLRKEGESIDKGVAERELELLEKENTLLKEEPEMKKRIGKLLVEKEMMERKRYTTLLRALDKVNEALRSVYQRLNPQGDAYLSYSREPLTLFGSGVEFLCKPDRSSYRKVDQLSGGQRALCTVALQISLRSIFNSPVWVLDEIDAPLDTTKAAVVGETLHEEADQGLYSRAGQESGTGPSAGQFIVVSHRPEFYQSADHMVAVYGSSSGSHAMATSFQ